jgi:hypothetical protein
MLYHLSYASKLRDRALLRRKSPYGSLSDDRDNFKRYHKGQTACNQSVYLSNLTRNAARP